MQIACQPRMGIQVFVLQSLVAAEPGPDRGHCPVPDGLAPIPDSGPLAHTPVVPQTNVSARPRTRTAAAVAFAAVRH